VKNNTEVKSVTLNSDTSKTVITFADGSEVAVVCTFFPLFIAIWEDKLSQVFFGSANERYLSRIMWL